MNFIEQLQSIPDYRKKKGKRHELWLVLLLTLLGAMTGYWGTWEAGEQGAGGRGK